MSYRKSIYILNNFPNHMKSFYCNKNLADVNREYKNERPTNEQNFLFSEVYIRLYVFILTIHYVLQFSILHIRTNSSKIYLYLQQWFSFFPKQGIRPSIFIVFKSGCFSSSLLKKKVQHKIFLLEKKIIAAMCK